MFYFDEINGKKILKSDILETEHFFTTRECCIYSKEPESEEIVNKNREIVRKYLRVDRLISPNQTHTSHVELAVKDKTFYPDTDGLIVKDKDFAIFLNFADCTPVIIYDKVKHIGAVSHAGWRGTSGEISKKTALKMIQDFSCNPNNMTAVIGPAISMCCYNVGQDVYNKLKSTVNDFEGLSEIREGKIFVDLKGINARQLEEAGIRQIDICPYCTCCDNDIFFSYRKENATTNRHSAILKL